MFLKDVLVNALMYNLEGGKLLVYLLQKCTVFILVYSVRHVSYKAPIHKVVVIHVGAASSNLL